MKKLEKTKSASIEESFKSLDKIISDLDNEKCTIEKSIELYEKGSKLLNELTKKIDKIEKDLKVIGK